MNIFALSDDPEQAARMQCNRHIVKMPTETVNLLLWVLKRNNIRPYTNRQGKEIALTHENHPATIWAGKSLENFEWLLEHGRALCDEYRIRYKREHAAQKIIDHIDEQDYIFFRFGYSGLTSFIRCFSEFKKDLDQKFPFDAIRAYREFYWLDKKDFAKWPSLEKIPDWWPEKTENFVDKNFKSGKYIKRQ